MKLKALVLCDTDAVFYGSNKTAYENTNHENKYGIKRNY